MTSRSRPGGLTWPAVLGTERAAFIDGWADRLGLAGKAVLTTSEAAVILRVSERSVRQAIKDGRIPCARVGRRVLIPVPMLLAMLLGTTAAED